MAGKRTERTNRSTRSAVRVVAALLALLVLGVMASGALADGDPLAALTAITGTSTSPDTTGASSTSSDDTSTSTDATSTDATTTTDTGTTTDASTTTDATTNSSLGLSPSISSDQADYSPGSIVTLTGSGWGAGESVHVFVNDTLGQTWQYRVDVTADLNGAFSTAFQLPNYFVSDYDVTATGAAGETATTRFTDGNISGATIDTRESTCTTTKVAFAAGDTVCAHVTATINGGGSTSWRIQWYAPGVIPASGTPTKDDLFTEVAGTTNVTKNPTLAVSLAGTWTVVVCKTGNAGSCSAGNQVTTATFTVAADTTAPTTSATGTNADTTGYAAGNWTNQNVSVALSATDNSGGSGVKSITFSATGAQTITSSTVNASTTTVPTITAQGTTTITYHATDVANNVEADKTFVVKIDKTAPTLTISAKLHGTSTDYTSGAWTNQSVDVSFNCADTGGSGVNASTVPANETDATTTSYSKTCKDVAGNSSSTASFQVNIDTTPPTITASASTVDGPYTTATWTNKTVTVHFTCSDSASGIAGSCPADVVVSAETTAAGQDVSRSVSDTAGNSSSSNTVNVRVDKTAPVIADLGPTTTPNANHWYKQDVVNRFDVSDGLSGLDAACVTAFPLSSGDHVQSKTTSGEGTAVQVSSSSCTDVAGNTASAIDSAKFKIDETAPTVAYTSQSPLANGAGWNNSDVTATFTATDTLSGFGASGDATTTGADVSVGEGSAVTVDSPAFTDAAGNTVAAGAASHAFKIDKSTPTIGDLGPTSDPNDAGWYNHDVVNRFDVSDGLSGLSAACVTAFPSNGSGDNVQSKTTSGEGTAVQVSSSSCTDVAGNTASAIDSAKFKIDETAPTVAYTSQSPLANGAGWNNSDVTATFTATDTLSGFGAAGDLTTTDTSVSVGEGNPVTVDSPAFTDAAGNTAVAGAASQGFRIDRSAPTIGDLGPTALPNANGWYKQDVVNRFDVSDGLSGLSAACVTAFPSNGSGDNVQSKTTSGEGTAVKVSSDGCTDVAGNTASSIDSAHFKVDKTAPTVAYTSQSPEPNAAGWNNTNVTATFTATDTLSGFGATGELTITDTNVSVGEGNPVTVDSPAFTDAAGNTVAAGNTSRGFKIDKTAPTIGNLGPTTLPNANGWYKQDVVNRFDVSDGLSGLDAACATAFPLSSGDHVQSKTTTGEATAVQVSSDSCTDVAGNTASAIDSAKFKVDETAPTVAYTSQSPLANGAGWNNSDVTATFTATDTLSGFGAAGDLTTTDTNDSVGEGNPVTVNSPAFTDAAGNTVAAGNTSHDFKIDKTAPVIADLGPTTTPNANHWYNHDVVNRFDVSDGLSGLDAACVTAFPASGADNVQSKTTSGEGTAVKVSSDSCTDVAGNTASAIDSAHFKVDETAPTVAYTSQSPLANGAGWNNSDVTATFTATDSLSGFGATGDPTTTGTNVSVGEGNLVTVDSPAFTDAAGNTVAAGTTSHGFKIDKNAPLILDLGPTTLPNDNGWYNHDVVNQFDVSDGLSGLNAACLTAFPASGADNVQSKTTSSEGTAVKVSSDSCTDVAGNTAASIDSATFKVDKTAPTVAYTSQSPLANGAGWNKTDVTATFTATDGLSGFGSSGDHTTTGTNDSVGEGNPVTVNSPAFTDAAGNTVTAGTASHDFKIDKTAPTITFTGQSPAKNGNGWNKGNVTLGWSCSDALSGPSPATTSQLVATEGSHQQATGTCADVAGNTASSTDGDVNLDKTNPLLNVSGAADGATFNVCSLPARPAFAPSDALSGVDTQSDSWVKPTTTSGVGTYTYTATATDKAGNMATQSRTYTDTYGTAAVTAVPFLQPINQDGSSRFKLGSTIPVKFQAMCSGAPVSAVVAKMYVKQGDSQPDPGTDEAISTSAATTGNLFRYDGSGQQYIFNLSTKLGYVNPDNTTINSFVQGTWTLTIGLDDGSFRSIKVQLVK